MSRITLDGDWRGVAATRELCRSLETGDILYFPNSPFPLSDDDRSFLIGQRQASSAFHKNVSYRPAEDRLKGVNTESTERMLEVMQSFSQRAINFAAAFLPSYAASWKVDYASFRPLEEQGRKVKFKARNDLLHVDAFPTRPSHGDRLLRIFSNIHPDRPRVWATAANFERLAMRYAFRVGLPALPPNPVGLALDGAKRALNKLGLPVVDRPAYDRFMLKFHDFLKANADFQERGGKDTWEFPPGSSWLVFTDTVSHACLSGQFALEQTLIVRREGLVHPELAPIAILERMTGFPLTPSRRVA